MSLEAVYVLFFSAYSFGIITYSLATTAPYFFLVVLEIFNQVVGKIL